MHYTVKTRPPAERFLRGLNDSNLYARFSMAIDALATNPRPPGCRKLHGHPPRYRVRVGDYRIVYQIDDASQILRILAIGHRRDIYR